MKKLTSILTICVLATGCRLAHAQNAEATATPTVPSLNRAPEPDEFIYTLGASQSVLFGYNGYSGATTSTAFDGTATYVSGSQAHPFSAIYSGGYFLGDNSGQPSGSFQNLGLSQQFIGKNVSFVVGDLVSYLPEAPVFGLSGVPGVGDVGTEPIGTGGVPLDSILSYYGRRISNTSSGSVSARASATTSITGYASYTLQHFIDDVGIDNDELDTGVNVNHRINAKNTIGAGYLFSDFWYSPSSAFAAYVPPDFSFDTQEVDLQYEHVFSRRLVLNASIGPEWTHSSDSGYLPSQTTVAVSAVLSYAQRLTTYLLSYSRGSTAGSGVLTGTTSDNVNFTINHSFSRNWSGSFSTNYGHATSLAELYNTDSDATTYYAGVQATRRIGRFFSAYASYNYEYQSLSGPLLTPLAFSGSANVLGFGIFYKPRPLHVHHQ
jgi:hypothetical protein